jgi:hypothetical protein
MRNNDSSRKTPAPARSTFLVYWITVYSETSGLFSGLSVQKTNTERTEAMEQSAETIWNWSEGEHLHKCTEYKFQRYVYVI